MKSRPTAIFCNNDEMASGACFAVHEAGLQIPNDVSVAGFDDIPLARQIWPPLTANQLMGYDKLIYLMHDDPKAMHELMDKVT